uniref:Thioredoxin n=1 Tax=candidate division WOR-3 bacterium TaxID=2052148 RepID=A0A7C3J564_UNCW3
MKSLNLKLSFILLLLFLFSCTPSENDKQIKSEENLNFEKFKITFIEIGSTTCIPCQMMQPIMKEIRDSFPKDVQVIFYDLNDRNNLKYAQKYMIRVIPTQIFIDSKGEIVEKHEGFFPKDEIFKFLKSKGIKQ